MVSREQGNAVIVIGADSHKRSHTVVAVDEVEAPAGRADRQGDQRRPPGTAAVVGVLAAGDLRVGGLPAPDPPAGSRPAGRAAVVRVPTRLMAATRAAAATGKSDPIDAEAVARWPRCAT